MKYFRVFIVLLPLFFLGCTEGQDFDLERALPGNGVVAVDVFLDESKTPVVVKPKVYLKPNQRVLFVGPNNFSIEFIKGSPFPKYQYAAKNSIIDLQVPADVFKGVDPSIKVLVFKYNVIIDGNLLDPLIVIMR